MEDFIERDNQRKELLAKIAKLEYENESLRKQNFLLRKSAKIQTLGSPKPPTKQEIESMSYDSYLRTPY